MYSANEPEAKKCKETNESYYVPPMKFFDPETSHDRVLIVEGKKFYIESELLTKHSEFFRAMFTSNFTEKDKKQNELDNVSAEAFEDFLLAISNPGSYVGDSVGWGFEKKLVSLIKTCSYLMAIPTLVQILTLLNCFIEKCTKIDYGTLLELAEDNGIIEIKKKVEEVMVEEYKKSRSHFRLAVKFRLNKLLDHMEKLYFDGDMCELVYTQWLLNAYNMENSEYSLERIKNFENKYIKTLRECSEGVLKKDYGKHVEYAKNERLENLEKVIGEIVTSALENNKTDGKINEEHLELTSEFSKYNRFIEAYLSNYFEETFKRNNAIANIEYVFHHNQYCHKYGECCKYEYRFSTFQKFLAKTFHGRAPNDPLFTENEEAFDNLSPEARGFVFNSMRKDPSFVDEPTD